MGKIADLLTSELPGPTVLWRIAAYAIAAVALFALGYVKGDAHGTKKYDDYVAAQAVETVKLARARDVVTHEVEVRYVGLSDKQKTITETITKEVPIYVPTTDPALGSGFRELHDAAAEGRLPDPTRAAHGAPVPAQTVAGTVTSNYGVCRQEELKLEELQNWILDQLKVRHQVNVETR